MFWQSPVPKLVWTVGPLLSCFSAIACFLMGLPVEFLCDNFTLLHSQFFTTLAELSGIDKYHSVVYRHKSNRRPESAVQGVMMALRKYLCQQGGSWYHALPMGVWGLSDLPGIVAL